MFRYRSFIKILRKVKDYRERCTSAAPVEEQINPGPSHLPVMKNEVAACLSLNDGDTVLDMTFGAGGHSKHLLEHCPNLKIIALDRDPLAYEFAKSLQKELPKNQITPLLGKFSDFPELAQKNNISFQSVDAVLCDLGASSMQMDTASRGFALSKCGPLDMRMDGDRASENVTAADIINYASEDDLYKIFKIYGQEKRSRLIARSIIQARLMYQNFKTTSDLADLVSLVIKQPRRDKLQRWAHSATKVFQALRIFVNNEMNELNHALILSNYYLKMGGKIAVLTFHSLEDTLVKRHFQGHIHDNVPCPTPPRFKNPAINVADEVSSFRRKPWQPVNKKVIVPTKEEVDMNPRSRSAKLRVALKINQIH